MNSRASRKSVESQPDLIALIAESREAQIQADQEIKTHQASEQERLRELQSSEASVKTRLEVSKRGLGENRRKVLPHMDPVQVAYLRAVQTSASSSAPLRDVEAMVNELTALQTRIGRLVTDRDSARSKLQRLIGADAAACREAWAKAAEHNGGVRRWAILGYLILPSILGLFSGGISLISLLIGIVTTVQIIWSKSTYPAQMLGRSVDQGDPVVLSQRERFDVLLRGWSGLVLLAPLVTLLVGAVT